MSDRRRTTERRLQRLLAMLPWLMERSEVPLAEVARRYEISEADVVKDLELVAMCGLPPYIDEMIDVFVDEGTVYVGVPRVFTRPLRLTAPEAFALLAASRAAIELPGVERSDPLVRALAKLARAVADPTLAGPGGDDTAGVVVDLERPPLVDRMVEAVAERQVLAIEYFTPSRGEVTTRVITPRHVFVDGGNWYLVADDRRSAASRTFRIDRIEGVRTTGDVAEPAEVSIPAFFDDAELPVVRLSLAPEASWVIDRYPMLEVGAPDPAGWIEVSLVASSEWWLDRLLVRLGPAVDVIDAPGAVERARGLADRMLARYGSPSRNGVS